MGNHNSKMSKSISQQEQEDQYVQGSLHVCIGPMYAGKTTKLIETYEDMLSEYKKTIVLTHSSEIRYSIEKLSTHDEQHISCFKYDSIDAKIIVKEARNGDKVALKTLKMMGSVLGECIVSSVRTLDIHTILIGGGVAKAYNMLEKSMYKTINNYLTPYYLEDFEIKLATLGNDAGMIGAASLCFCSMDDDIPAELVK